MLHLIVLLITDFQQRLKLENVLFYILNIYKDIKNILIVSNF
jgi:hypothetical protein